MQIQDVFGAIYSSYEEYESEKLDGDARRENGTNEPRIIGLTTTDADGTVRTVPVEWHFAPAQPLRVNTAIRPQNALRDEKDADSADTDTAEIFDSLQGATDV